MNRMRLTCAWLPFVLVLSPLVAFAQFEQQQEGSPQQLQQQPDPQPQFEVVATVNGDPITAPEVQANLHAQQRDNQAGPQAAQQTEQQVIDGLVASRLVEQFVLENGPQVEEREVTAEMEGLKQTLQAQNGTLDGFLKARGDTIESFEKRLEGWLAWQKFQQQQMTDKNLQAFYQQNQNLFEAGSFEQARKEVIEAYATALWKGIVEQMKPNAEVRMQRPPE